MKPLYIGLIITAFLIGFFVFAPDPNQLTPEQLRHRATIKSWLENPAIEKSNDEIKNSREKFSPLEPDVADQKEEFEKTIKELQDAYYKANLSAFQSLSKDEKTTINQLLVLHSDAFFEHAKHLSSFVHVGDPIFEACVKAIDPVIRKIEKREVKLSGGEVDANQLKSGEFDDYKKNCGDALPILVNHGLVKEGVGWTVPYGEQIFEAMQRRRFVDLIILRLPPEQSLSAADQWLMLWWKTMMPEAFSLGERGEFLSRFKMSKSEGNELKDANGRFFFDVNRAETSLNYSMSGYDGARKFFRKRCETEIDVKLKEICDAFEY